MNFRAAQRRLNRLFPPPSRDDLVGEQVSAALRPLTYDQKLRLRDFLKARLEDTDKQVPPLTDDQKLWLHDHLEGKPNGNDKRELQSIFKTAERRKKKQIRPKKSDGRSRATKQPPSTSSGVRRRKNRRQASPTGLTTTNKAAPLAVLTASNDPVPAKGSVATDDARRAKVSPVPDSAMPPTVKAVPNDPILALHPLLRPQGVGDHALAKRVQNLPPERRARFVAEFDAGIKFEKFLKGRAKLSREGRRPQ